VAGWTSREAVSTNGAWPATARIAAEGNIAMDGQEFRNPSSAAIAVKGGPANG